MAAENAAKNSAVERKMPYRPELIELSYHHRSPWQITMIEDDIERWSVHADVYSHGGRRLGHVGSMQFVMIDLDETPFPWDMLDASDGDLATVGGAIFDLREGGLREELQKGFNNRALILDRAILDEKWRGFGIGALLIGTAIKRLSGGVEIVACIPSPIAGTSMKTRPDSPERKAAAKKLSGVYAQLGFKHLRDGVHVVSMAEKFFYDSLETLEKRFGAGN